MEEEEEGENVLKVGNILDLLFWCKTASSVGQLAAAAAGRERGGLLSAAAAAATVVVGLKL